MWQFAALPGAAACRTVRPRLAFHLRRVAQGDGDGGGVGQSGSHQAYITERRSACNKENEASWRQTLHSVDMLSLSGWQNICTARLALRATSSCSTHARRAKSFFCTQLGIAIHHFARFPGNIIPCAAVSSLVSIHAHCMHPLPCLLL